MSEPGATARLLARRSDPGTRALPPPEQLRSAIAAQGYLLLKGIFEREHMDRLRGELDAARRAEEARFGLSQLQEIGQDGYVSDFLAIGRALEEVLESPELQVTLEALMGDEARLYIGQGIVLDPGKGRGMWPRCWHADMYGVRQEIGDPTFCYGINCLLLVDDITLENGATGVLAGSHGLADICTEKEDDLVGVEFRATAPSGSLLLIDGGVWHSAGLNRSQEPRRVVKMLFTRDWIRPQIDYSATVEPAVAERLSACVRRLLRLEEASPVAGGES